MQEVQISRLIGRLHETGFRPPYHDSRSRANNRYHATVPSIVSLATGFFQTVGLLFTGTALWCKDQAIAYMPARQSDVVKDLVLRGSIQEMDRLLESISQGEMGWRSKVSILKILIDLPAQERAQVARNAALLIPSEAASLNKVAVDIGKVAIVLRVARIPANERNDAIDFVLQVMNNEKISWGDRIAVLDAVMEIPEEERVNALQLLLQPKALQRSLFDKIQLIRMISRDLGGSGGGLVREQGFEPTSSTW